MDIKRQNDMHEEFKKHNYKIQAYFAVPLIIFSVLLLFRYFHGDDKGSTNDHFYQNAEDAQICSKYADFPYCYSQSGCYVEDGLYILMYTFSNMDYCLLRCYDSNINQYIWEKHIEGGGHANAICFRPNDRRLYIADCFGEDGNKTNTITVVGYDNIDNGVVDIIVSPARGAIVGIAHDRDTDTFYSTNYQGSGDGEANALFEYIGVFEKVKSEIHMNDFSVNHEPYYNPQGLQCVANGVAYVPYFEPENLVAGYDVLSGNLKFACKIPDVIDNYAVKELEGVIYDYDKKKLCVIDAFGLLEIISPKVDIKNIDKYNVPEANCRLIKEIPTRWTLCGCYVENDKYCIAHVASDGFGLVIRCYDVKKGKAIWTYFLEGHYFANSICYRPYDGNLYIANAYTYSENNLGAFGNIIVMDFDNIERGVLKTIDSPARGGIYSIAYDIYTDVFYSTNYFDDEEGTMNVLFSYNGIFESVRNELDISDKLSISCNMNCKSMGVQCVKDNIAYFLYYYPDNIIVGYDISSGNIKFSYSIPSNTNEGMDVGRPESLAFNYDDKKIYIQTAIGLYAFE